MYRSAILLALIITTLFFTCCSDSDGPDDQKTAPAFNRSQTLKTFRHLSAMSFSEFFYNGGT